MCTLIALHRCIPGAPLVVAANRDEYADRPSHAPTLRETPFGSVLAPLDVRAGGTWLGVNDRGLFAAITNRRSDAPDPKRRSRGLLVLDALAAGSAEEAAQAALGVAAGAYNPFNLFVADAQRAFVVSYAEAPACLELPAGPHVIGNSDPAAPPPAKLARLAGKAEQLAASRGEALLDGLAGLCRDHDGGAGPGEDACVHADRYGTRSSTLLRLAESASDDALFHADGAPCRTAYDDYTHLLRELRRGSGRAPEESLRGDRVETHR